MHPVCPLCLGSRPTSFYTVAKVPAHSVLLMDTHEEAVSYPCGRIDLHRCPDCDFVFNAAFDVSLNQYSERYEETQGFSSTFRAFHRGLAERLIERWDLHGKRVLEIGCGKGEFLALLCELGSNSGVGFDPAFVPGRGPAVEGVDLSFHQEMYPPRRGAAVLEVPPDFVCCKMTLEHIPGVRAFVTDIRRSLPDATAVFFQVPNAERIFRDGAFWDIYYEHCSYFTRAALVHLFESCGFEVAETWTDYGDQYLFLTAVTSAGGFGRPSAGVAGGVANVPEGADRGDFSTRVAAEVDGWRRRIDREREGGGCVCLWGAGSKAVAFLSAVGFDRVCCAVDVNPHKAGTYLPGSGIEIAGPVELRRRRPSLVIAMNAVYREEITRDLARMGIATRLEALR